MQHMEDENIGKLLFAQIRQSAPWRKITESMCAVSSPHF
jgi:hypothetical protein